MRAKAVIVIVLAAAVVATGGATGARSDAGGDVRTLVAELERLHPQPYHAVSHEAFHRAADDLAARAPGLRRDQLLVETMRLIALLGEREGHSGIFPLDPSHRIDLNAYPWRLWRFPDGYYVIQAADRSLVGSRLTAVAGLPVTEVETRVRPHGHARQRLEPRLRAAVLPRERRGPPRARNHAPRGRDDLHGRHPERPPA